MRAGCGRAGDFSGDPLVLSAEYLRWLNSGKTSILASFSPFPEGLPAHKWITYKNGAKEGAGVLSPQAFATSANVVPNIAAVAVSDQSYTSDYDPLGSEDVANVITLLQKVLNPSSQLDPETEPTKDQLWALQYLFAINWKKGVVLNQAFDTDIKQSFNDRETRWGLIDTPRRTMTASLLVRGKTNMRNLRNLMARAAKARWLVPLYCDEAQINGTVSGDTIPCNAENKRFTPGMIVAVVKFDEEKRTIVQMQVTTLNGNTDTTVEAVGLDSGFGPGDYVYPLFEAELALDFEADVLSDELFEVQLQATESFGDWSIYTFEQTQALPEQLQQFQGKLVLDVGYDYSGKMSVGVSRTGEYTQIGRGKSLQLYGDRARWTYKLNYRQLTREDSVRLIRFFEAVGGRLESFYVVSPTHDLPATSIAAGSVNLVAQGPEIDWEGYTHIAVILKTGQVIMRAITSVQRVGNADIVNFSNFGITPTIAEVARISFAHLARLNSDSMDENWIRDTIMETSFEVIEVFDESDITIDNLADFSLCEVTPPPPPPPPSDMTAPEAQRRQRQQADRPYNTPISAPVYTTATLSGGVYPTALERVGKGQFSFFFTDTIRDRLIIRYDLPNPVTEWLEPRVALTPRVKGTTGEPFELQVYVVDGISEDDFELIDPDRLLATVADTAFAVESETVVSLDASKLADYVGVSSIYLLFVTNAEAHDAGIGSDPSGTSYVISGFLPFNNANQGIRAVSQLSRLITKDI